MPSAKQSGEVLKSLRALMQSAAHAAEAIDAYIVPMADAHQSEYIAACDGRLRFVCGFSGSHGTAVATLAHAALWTDGRYFIQANEQMDDNWTLMKEGVPDAKTPAEWLVKTLATGARVGIDPTLIAASNYSRLSEQLSAGGLHLTAISKNLIDVVWGAARPPPPQSAVVILPVELSGMSWQEKVTEVRKKMTDERAKLLVLSALDDIAWLFNLRASDIPHNPVFFAYTIIGLDHISLFVDESRLSAAVREHLTANGESGLSVNVGAYDDVLAELRRRVGECVEKSTDKVWLPEGAISQAIAALVPEKNRLKKLSPVHKAKMVKNEVELAGMRHAHLKDAVAHCEFLVWLEARIAEAAGDLTELSAAAHFETLRKEQADYVELSFTTISATGAHAALCHYAPTAETDAVVRADCLYLVDSGAQYRDGTTDVTRTVCFDEPSAYQKRCFTLVLKGHIAVATQPFPDGTPGARLDSFARAPLWRFGLEYRHGTGHGVGHYLNVHEGPVGIGTRVRNWEETGIKPGVILTIEPGYYEADQFGIRIENVYEVVPAETEFNFEAQQYLTFKSLTLVPIQKRMLDPSLLTADEIQWLNAYHVRVLAEVGAELEAQNKSHIVKWLQEQCAPLG